MTTPTPIPTTIPVKDADRITLTNIREQVLTVIMLTTEDPPDVNIVLGALDLELADPAYAEWPISNARGLQSDYLMRLSESTRARLGRKVAQEDGVAESYQAASTALPEVAQVQGGGEVVAEEE